MSEPGSREGAVLVPTGRQLKSHAVVRSLGRRGVSTVVASELGDVPQFASRYCTERVRLGAGPDDLPGYRDALLAQAARPDVSTIVPIREADVYVVARDRDAFDEHVSVVVPDLPTLRRGHDRLRLAELAEEAGVPCAETRRLGDVGTVEQPSVVKSRYNLLTSEYVGGYPDDAVEEVKDVRYFDPGDRPDVDAITTAMRHEPIVQEYVDRADKQLYCGLWVDGDPVATYQHREVRGSSWVGGGGVYRVSNHDPEVERVAHDLLEHIEWHGLACIEYIQDADTGEWKFLEINPRMWQSLPAAVQAGADFPFYYWQAATGRADAVDASYRHGVGCHQLYGELGYLASLVTDESSMAERPSIPRALWEVSSSLATQPRFDYLHRDDPRFFLAAVRGALVSDGDGGREFHSGRDRAAPAADGGAPERPCGGADER
jgi:predicted ATP-grasp superfamily ATP-dependent carboligase